MKPGLILLASAFSATAQFGPVVTAGIRAWHHLLRLELARVPAFKVSAHSQPQPNVVSGTKANALHLTIHLWDDANITQVAKFAARLADLVEEVSPRNAATADTELLAGVGFGAEFYAKLGKKTPDDFEYKSRYGENGAMPSTGGDLFIHAKSNTLGKLYELAALVEAGLGQVKGLEDVYGWVYREGRDLSGFIDGTANRRDEEGRRQVALIPYSGASYCITQKWIHDHRRIRSEKSSTLEKFIGRRLNDSAELHNKPPTSHVARMTSGSEYGAEKPVEIVRQSMPYGTVGTHSGLFFIAFAASPHNFNYMLERMVGGEDGLSDDVMKMSTNVQGTFWYFPSVQELSQL